MEKWRAGFVSSPQRGRELNGEKGMYVRGGKERMKVGKIKTWSRKTDRLFLCGALGLFLIRPYSTLMFKGKKNGERRARSS